MSEQASITHIRPRFAFRVPHPPQETMDRLIQMKEAHQQELSGYVSGHHIVLDIPHEQRHYFSPQLSFRVEEDDEHPGQSIIKGLIGPRPAVWTLFVFFYFSIGTLGFFVSLFGLSKWQISGYSHWVWAFPVAILFMATAYLAGREGERLAREQVEQLKNFVREALPEREVIKR